MPSIADKLRQEGFEQGFKQGFEQGFEEGLKKGILKMLEKKFQEVPQSLNEQLNHVQDLPKLKKILDYSIRAQSLRDFWDKINPII